MKAVLRYLNYGRLALFVMGYGLTGALVGGTLNRVMVADLGLSVALVGLFLAAPRLISPVRIWLGYRSDGFPIMGRRREPYIIAGALLTALAISTVVVMIVNADNAPVLLALVLVAFLVYGFGRNLGHNSYQALLSDKFTGKSRTRAITLYEVATLFGSVVGAGALGGALETFDPARLVTVTIGAMVVMVVLSLIAAPGQEPRDQVLEEATEKAREMPFPQVLRDIVWADPQVRLFFMLVLFTFVGTLAQDVLLEPYGALVLGMAVGETTRLTAFWGIGVLISMLLSGIFLLGWLGYMTVLRIGLISSMLVFAGVIVTGLMGNVNAFQSLVFVMGLGTGLAGAGMLSGVISFTTVIRAGVLMGVWGVANQVGYAFGNLMGGSVVEIVLRTTGGNAFVAYATVFALEIVMLIVALFLSTRLDFAVSHAQTEEEQVLVHTEAAAAVT